MGSGYLATPAIFLIQVIFGAAILLVLLRFLLQWVRANFYNPVSQFIVQVTSPVLSPMRRVIPSLGGIDTASLVLIWVLQAVELMLVVSIAGLGFHFIGAFLWAIPALVELVLNLYLVIILIQVIISWVNPGAYNPALTLLDNLAEPLLSPARRMLPPMSGLDLSPMLVMIGIVLLKMLLLPPLRQITGSPL